ncbi:MAG: AarF/UbiB family protein [Candidatus Sericytochromatia bacterium]|nr:AarF/UbiB family protein [Candidatus Sericytochromatia bacterium]
MSDLPRAARQASGPPNANQRRAEIASILARYGWDVLLLRLSLLEVLPAGLRQQIQMSSFLVRRQREEEMDEGESEHDPTLPLPSVLRQILIELGPTYVKLGQVLSTRADLLPQPYIDELAKLQEQVPPAPWRDIEQVILEEWTSLNPAGPRPHNVHDIFPAFDTTPIACGSLGQVYRATVDEDGRLLPVIVKVQRPGIDAVVEADMAVLLDFAKLIAARTRWGQWNDVEGLAEEFAAVLRAELDFTKEAAHTEEIGRNLAETGEDVRTPRIIHAYTSKRLQAQEFMTGSKVSVLFPRADGAPAEVTLSLEQRRRLAALITTCFLRQIFVDGLFHADPHPGNVMFSDRGEGRMPGLLLIDFGMVGRTDPRSREILIDFFLAMIQFDAARATDRILEYGHPQGRVDRQALTIAMDHLLRDFLGRPAAEVQMGKLMQRVLELMTRYRVRMPTSFLLISRVLVTLEGICRQLDPDYMLVKVAEPFIRGIVRGQFTGLLKGPEFMRFALDVRNVLVRSPRRLDDLLAQLNSGQIRIETDIRDMRRFERTLTGIGNRLSMAWLVAGLLVAGAGLSGLSDGPRVLGLPVASLVTFGMAGVLGTWLLVLLTRSGPLR